MQNDKAAMTPDEFYRRMRRIMQSAWEDRERAHAEGDDLMCELLTQLGYDRGVQVFRNTEKWYA